jgi:hypothetical protein
MTQDFPRVEVDIRGAGDYVAKADAKIRRVKETYRKVTSRLNIRRTTALAENICPRVLFTGIPMDYKRELTYAFGDYVKAYEGTTNKSRARSAACITLYPTGNSIGSWVLWKIDTRSRVRRSNMVKLVTTDNIILIMNTVASEESGETRVRPVESPSESQDGENLGSIPGVTQVENPETNQGAIQAENQEVLPEEIPEEIQEDQSVGNRDDDEEPIVTTRSGRQIVRPSSYAAVTRVSRDASKEALATQAIKKELRQLFEELVALVPLKKENIPNEATVLKSHMFLVNKYIANGDFKKVEARLVADGQDQDPAMYPNKSSPTVALHSVFTVLGMAAEKRWQVVAKVDIKGAFVQTSMSGPPIFMRLDPKVVRYAQRNVPGI